MAHKKPSLRERMESMLERIVTRRQMLEQHVKEYQESGFGIMEARADAKHSTFLLIEEELRRELQE